MSDTRTYTVGPTLGQLLQERDELADRFGTERTFCSMLSLDEAEKIFDEDHLLLRKVDEDFLWRDNFLARGAFTFDGLELVWDVPIMTLREHYREDLRRYSREVWAPAVDKAIFEFLSRNVTFPDLMDSEDELGDHEKFEDALPGNEEQVNFSTGLGPFEREPVDFAEVFTRKEDPKRNGCTPECSACDDAETATESPSDQVTADDARIDDALSNVMDRYHALGRSIDTLFDEWKRS